ncbi:unnamed protein product [Arabidopsis halleri]
MEKRYKRSPGAGDRSIQGVDRSIPIVTMKPKVPVARDRSIPGRGSIDPTLVRQEVINRKLGIDRSRWGSIDPPFSTTRPVFLNRVYLPFSVLGYKNPEKPIFLSTLSFCNFLRALL